MFRATASSFFPFHRTVTSLAAVTAARAGAGLSAAAASPPPAQQQPWMPFSGSQSGGYAPRSSSQSVLDTFLQIQLGTWTPTSQSARQVLAANFAPRLAKMGLNEAKLAAMDPKKVIKLLRQVLYEQYLAVPFTLLSFDLEFTGPPAMGTDGRPTQDIVEIALYDPDRRRVFEQLVRPSSERRMSGGAAAITGLTDELLRAKGLPLVEAWNKAVEFVEETVRLNIRERAQDDEMASFVVQQQHQQRKAAAQAAGAADPDAIEAQLLAARVAEERLLLLSHGAKLADIAMINFVQSSVPGARALPGHASGRLHFGDTLLHIKDLHRRRPVTKDKWPPAWALEDIAAFLGLAVSQSHRAAPDAVMTWEALYHTLDRYGDDSLAPRQQLVARFFDSEAKTALSRLDERHAAVRHQQQQGLALRKNSGGRGAVAAPTPSFADGGDAGAYEIQEKPAVQGMSAEDVQHVQQHERQAKEARRKSSTRL